MGGGVHAGFTLLFFSVFVEPACAVECESADVLTDVDVFGCNCFDYLEFLLVEEDSHADVTGHVRVPVSYVCG